jgi:hypothetical protein
MATVDKQGVVTMQELLVSSLTTADALAKLRMGFIGLILLHLTVCLITLAALAISSTASAEQRMVELLFARDVIDREPVGPFEPGAYCEREAEPTGPIPVVDSQTERRVIFWSIFMSSAEGIVRHSWYKDGFELYVVNLKIGKSESWRSWSWKNIVPNDNTGKWKVVVSTTGEAGEVICVAHFVVK